MKTFHQRFRILHFRRNITNHPDKTESVYKQGTQRIEEKQETQKRHEKKRFRDAVEKNTSLRFLRKKMEIRNPSSKKSKQKRYKNRRYKLTDC